MEIHKENHLLEQFEKTKSFKRFFSTLLRFDEELDCFISTEKWRDKEAELLTAAWWMFAEVANPQAAPEWISVEDGLPSEGDLLLGISTTKLAKFNVYQVVALDEFDDCEITHWMHLPQAPKAQEQSHE